MAFANILPPPPVDGISYAQNVPLPTQEADLGTPINLTFHQAIAATLTLNLVSGGSSSSSSKSSAQVGSGPTYVVMQTDDNDNNWIDIAWIVTSLAGLQTFLLSGGSSGANALKQTRSSGSAPAANGSNQTPLGARIRFVANGGAGQGTISVKYRLVPLR